MDLLPLVLASTRLIGWALVHFLWQGVLLGVIYGLIRFLVPRGEARYRLGMIALILLAFCPLLTVWRLLKVAGPAIPTLPDVAATTFVGPDITISFTWNSGLELVLPWMVLVWSCGVVFLSLRAWKQWHGVKELVRMADAMPLWQEVVNAMAKQFRLHRQVRVLCSKAVFTPALVGWIRPVILLPMAVVCNFPATQIELIFAHELAHLRRWDPVANLFQIVLETLHFYHPVVRWISRDVRNEREICCDAMALSISGGSRREFVAALAELGDLSERHGSLLLAASGGVLLDRVQQMVMPREPAPGRVSARFVAVLLGAMLIAVTLRLEWSQTQFQKNLSESIGQLQLTLVPQLRPLMQSMKATYWTDLVPAKVQVMRPLAKEHPVDALDDLVSLTIESKHRMVLQRLSLATVQVADLARAIDQPSVRFANPTAATDLRVTPAPIQIRQPVYPQVALVHGIEGAVTIEFGVAADGSVQDMRVVSAEPAGTFDQAALQAMRGWKYATIAAASPRRRYRQTMAFTLNATHVPKMLPNRTGSQQIQAQVGCQIPTGTHICRWPGNSESAGTSEAVSYYVGH